MIEHIGDRAATSGQVRERARIHRERAEACRGLAWSLRRQGAGLEYDAFRAAEECGMCAMWLENRLNETEFFGGAK